jgi:uncharacterized membrane protein
MSRRRSTLFFVSAGLFIVISFLDFPARATIDFAVMWVLWAALLLVNLAGIGGWFCPPIARAMANDEGTRANRARALSLGFFVAVGVALLLSILIRFLDIDAREVAIAIVTAGISSALICFAALERASLGDG